MKVTNPTDLDGRLIRVENRLRMLSESAAAHASAYGDCGPLSEESLSALATVLEEVADEVSAIQEESARQAGQVAS
jgi:hypothetical protein